MTEGRKVQCVVCAKHFDQNAATHYGAEVPPRKRWTCSGGCHSALLEQREKRANEKASLREQHAAELGLEDFVSDIRGVSEAEKARRTLHDVSQDQPKDGDPPDHLLTGDTSSERMAAAAAHLLAAASEVQGRDRVILLGIAHEVLGHAIERAEEL